MNNRGKISKTIGAKVLQTKVLLREKTRELDLLRQISETISCNLDLDQVLKQIIEIVVQVTRADACFLYLYNHRNKELTLKASQNPHPKLIGRVRLELGEGITGWVARERKPVAIEKNAGDDPRFKLFHNLPEDRYHAFLSIPVISKNEMIGVINVQHKRSHHHSRNELDLLTTIGHQVGGAIENARLYDEMERRAMQVDTLSQVSKTIASNRYLQEILQLIVTMTAEMMNSTICSIMLLVDEKQELEIVATQSLSEEYRKKPNLKVGQSVNGRAVQKKHPIAVLDVTQEPGYMYSDLARKEGLCSLLSVPMMIRDRVVGVINSYTSHEHRFNDEEIQILQAVANQAAVSIENTKLIKKSNEMQEALESRKVIERAKGILMREKNIIEDEAFRVLQRQSMNTRKSMKEIADAIILASEITQHE